MKFSIISITYNQPAQINALINSVVQLEFEFDQFELIIVDDGSFPQTSIVTEIPVSMNFRYIYLPRSNSSCRSRARNIGANRAIGRYLIFVDGDCIVGSSFINKYDKYFSIRKNRKVAIGSLGNTKYVLGLNVFDRDAINKHLSSNDSEDIRFDLEKIYHSHFCDILGNWMLFVSRNFCIEKSFFVYLNGFDERFIGWGSEDAEFAYRITRCGEKFDLIDNKSFHILSSQRDAADNNSGNRYFEWLANVAVFYKIHNDPAILLLILNEKVIFDCFCIGGEWNDAEHLRSFCNIHTRLMMLRSSERP